jgi:hypothetical protein
MLQLQYQLMRSAGRILGLDWSQANDDVFTYDPTPTQAEQESWPVMHPIDVLCGPYTYQCMVDPFMLRMDDAAALGRLYPVTYSNLSQYPGKQVLQAASLGLVGTVSFPNGQGMNGVNVVVREGVTFTNPIFVYPDVKTSSVSGFRYTGDAGNPVTGTTMPDGISLPEFGSTSPGDAGRYDLSGYQPAPAGVGWDFDVISFEAINPLYIGQYSVGPYTLNQVTPPGTFDTVYQAFAFDGAYQVVNMEVSDAPGDATMGAGGSWSQPEAVSATGWWDGRLGAPQQTPWFSLYAQGNRTFTVEVTALDENGLVSTAKAMPVIGLWNAVDAAGSAPDWSTSAFNGVGAGLTTLTVQNETAQEFRLALADQRGDGRPDFNYRARILYADTVTPALVSESGGILTVSGMGFRAGNQVRIAGVTAVVLNTIDSQMVVQAPALNSLPAVVTGVPVDIEISDATTGGTAVLSGGLTYVDSTTVNTGAEHLVALSGADQQIGAAQSFSPVVLQLQSSTGAPIAGASIQVSQAMYGWQPACTGAGRCASPPLLGTSATSLTTDSNGEVSITVLQLADTAVSTTIVVTAGANAMLQFTLDRHS